MQLRRAPNRADDAQARERRPLASSPGGGRHSGPQGRGGADPNRRDGFLLGPYPPRAGWRATAGTVRTGRRPRNALRCRPQIPVAEPVIAPSSDQQTRLSHPVPISRPGYRTQFRSADPAIAPSSDQQTRLSHPVPISRPGYRTQFRSADPVIAPSSEQPSRLSHPVPISRPGYRTQFRSADPVIAPSSELSADTNFCAQWETPDPFRTDGAPGDGGLGCFRTGFWEERRFGSGCGQAEGAERPERGRTPAERSGRL